MPVMQQEFHIVFNFTPLHLAANIGDVSKCELLLDNKANINATDDTGLTPLHWATTSQKLDCVEYFLNKGANTDLRDLVGILIFQLFIELHFISHFTKKTEELSSFFWIHMLIYQLKMYFFFFKLISEYGKKAKRSEWNQEYMIILLIYLFL